jgi:hypothetical protein
MDLNDFIYRDDTAETLGADVDTDESAVAGDAAGFITPAKVALTMIGGAVLGMSHFLGLAGKSL